MKIRNRLLLSYLALIALFTAGVFLIIDRIAIRELTRSSIAGSARALNTLANANCATARRLLTSYGEAIVDAEARASVNEMTRAPIGRTDLDDYTHMREDTALRAVAIHNIVVRGQVVGYTCLLDFKGNSVIHPQRELVEKRGYRVYQDSYPSLWTLVERSFTEPRVSGYYRFLDKETARPRDKYMVIMHVPGFPFSIAAMVFIDDFFTAMDKEVLHAAETAEAMVDGEVAASTRAAGARVKRLSLLVAAGLCLVAGAFAFWFAGSIARPVTRLRNAVHSMGHGDFSHRIETTGSGEIRELADAFNRLGGELTRYVANLQAETAARENVQSEIRFASEVQRSLLPHADAPAMRRPEYALAAGLRPARVIGGDFYDHFLVDDQTLLVALGDVSGKGVPAALYMAMCLILLRGYGMNERDPGRVLRSVNEVLRRDNDSATFVTVFCACYHIATGRLTFANAGHHAALLVRADGSVVPFGRLGDPAVGFGPVEVFHKGQARLEPGDRLVLYTDGASEAQGEDGVLFGSERLIALLKETRDLPPSDMVKKVTDAISEYQKGVLYDDITLLVLDRKA